MAAASWLVDLGHRGTLLASGPDCATWLEGLLSCEVAGLSETQSAWGLALTKQGKITTDLFLLQSGAGVFLSTAEGVGEELLSTLDRHLIMEDAEIEDLSAGHHWLLTTGPVARELLVDEEGVVASASFPALGEDAVLILARADLAEALAQRLLDGGCRRASAEEWAALRVQAGVPEWGADYDGTSTPHEAGIAHRAVSWTKGCYLGQEVVCMQDMRGKVRRQLVGLRLGQPAAPGELVFGASDDQVGELRTVAADSEGTLAWAMVQTKALDAPLQVAGQAAELLRPPTEG